MRRKTHTTADPPTPAVRGSARLTLVPAFLLVLAFLPVPPAPAGEPPIYGDWETFSQDDGLPADKIFALAATPEALWIGTEHGLTSYQDQRFTTYDTGDGLVYPVVSGLAWDAETGDVWIATFGGLSRFSGGRFESFTQLTSGLVNDVVYGVAVEGHAVWAVTAAGTSRYDTWDHSWEIFNNRNAPMHEIWCYGVAEGGGKVYLAVWGGGVLQYDLGTSRWREFRDPDGEMELDLLKDDGPVSDVVASVAWGDGILWAGTYFGANRYDGRRWTGYSKDDSGLASDFVNFVVADGPAAWFATDSGLSWSDGETWVTYRRHTDRAGGTVTIVNGDGERVLETPTSLADNFVTTVGRQGPALWVGTENGLSRAFAASQSTATGDR